MNSRLRRLAGFAVVTVALPAAPDLRRLGPADPPPLERVQTIALKGPVGGLDHLAVDAKRGRLFVANTVNGSLDVVDLKAGKLLKQVPGQGRIRGIDYSPEADRVFVGNGTGGVCNTFDGENYELLKSVPWASMPTTCVTTPGPGGFTSSTRTRNCRSSTPRTTPFAARSRCQEIWGVPTGNGPAADVRQRQGGAGRGDRHGEG